MAIDKYILVTGGAGYIGSHTVVELIQRGFKVVVIDSLVNSSYDAIVRAEYIVRSPIPFFKIDLHDKAALNKVFDDYAIEGVIHFAAFKAVGESAQKPLEYYENNVGGAVALLEVMSTHGVKTIVYSSSATVYGDVSRFKDHNYLPINEKCPTDPVSPYGKTKYAIENIIADLHSSDNSWRGAVLRYFNPIGAHPSGLLGEDPLGVPNNLLPYLAQVAVGRRDKLNVFGNDYDSRDGTPIRDYIHVVDLAQGHVAALEYLKTLEQGQGLYRVWNLGTGKGSTVLEIHAAFSAVVGRELPYNVVGRRAGDVLNLTADPTRANTELGWKAKLTVEDACRDLWKWTMENPYGFQVKNFKWSLFNDPGAEVNFASRLNTFTFGDFSVTIANYGATIQNIAFKGRTVVTSMDKLSLYQSDDNPAFGATVGRYANRIRNGTFSIDGVTYHTDKNWRGHTIHGGSRGFGRQFWLGPVAKSDETHGTLEFLIYDKDGSNGFPADVIATAKFTVDEKSLRLEIEARIPESSPKDVTAVNMTNHVYFNLSSGETIDGTIIKTCTDTILESDPDYLLPTGRVIQYKQKLSESVDLQPSNPIDNCFVAKVDGFKLDTRGDEMQTIVEAHHPSTGFKLTAATTDPAFQIYTGDFVDIGPYKARAGFCVEAQRYLEAINNEHWNKQVILRKGEVYGSDTIYTFSV
ncbi:gal10 [Schizosaccharomyces japonicus yFS275]|uniref:Gal10 n=1 Tax=Schizosaccharomyces japonicus (strain yFS275 / FY16936) TaxID=402676 RepID=B6K552_SCHJY|nr:gal10 [Schizosaccharomyces japonicus yFS275]EEB08656.1 gal10 [Schizosaccharomyces japonicus yFS275]